MITPQDVLNRSVNIYPYEQQIDALLREPWTDEMKKKGRRIILSIPPQAARDAGVLAFPSDTQLEILRRRYTDAGWVFRDDVKSECRAWVFEFPSGKRP